MTVIAMYIHMHAKPLMFIHIQVAINVTFEVDLPMFVSHVSVQGCL